MFLIMRPLLSSSLQPSPIFPPKFSKRPSDPNMKTPVSGEAVKQQAPATSATAAGGTTSSPAMHPKLKSKSKSHSHAAGQASSASVPASTSTPSSPSPSPLAVTPKAKRLDIMGMIHSSSGSAMVSKQEQIRAAAKAKAAKGLGAGGGKKHGSKDGAVSGAETLSCW